MPKRIDDDSQLMPNSKKRQSLLSPTPPTTDTSLTDTTYQNENVSKKTVKETRKLHSLVKPIKKRKKPRDLVRIGGKCFLVPKKTLREIREYRKFTQHVVPKSSFARVVREIMMEYMPDARIQTEALECLQEASEAYVTQYLEDSNCCAAHARRITLLQKDMELIRHLRGCNL